MENIPLLYTVYHKPIIAQQQFKETLMFTCFAFGDGQMLLCIHGGGVSFMAAWKAITVKVPLRAGRIADLLGDQLEKEMEAPKKDLENYVAPFRAKNKPKILMERKNSLDNISVFVGVKSNWSKGKRANASDKFMFNSRGTSKRYVAMSSDFRAKTSPNSLVSTPQRGNRDPMYIDIRGEQPGIEARNVEGQLETKYNRKIQSAMVRALPKIVIKAGISWFI